MTAIAELPGPRQVPVLGNALQLRPARLHVMLEQWGRRYGPAFRFTMGPREVVAFTEPETVNAILRERPDGYRRWRELESVADELGLSGPFTSEGDDWRRQRRLAVTALNSNHLRRYFEVIHLATERLHRRLADTGRRSRSSTTSCPTASTSRRRWPSGMTSTRSSTATASCSSTSRASSSCSPAARCRRSPYWHVVKPPADRAAERSLAVIHDEIDGFIAAAAGADAGPPGARRGARELPREHADDARLRRPRRVRQRLHDAAGGRGHDREHALVGDVPARPRPGRAASAWRPRPTPRWATDRIPAARRGRRPDALRRGGLPRGGAAEVDGAAAVLRAANADTHGGRRRAARRARAIVCLTRQIGRPQPRERFDPDRWLTDAADAKTFLSFGAGPRFCPGRNLAFLEGKTALTMLARNFDVGAGRRRAARALRLHDATDGPARDAAPA